MSGISALQIRRTLGRAAWLAPIPWGLGWAFKHRDGIGSIVVTPAIYDDQTWIHASIAWNAEMPSYEDLKLLHRAVYGDGWAYQVFAPPSDHVNIHNFALHLFGRADGKPALPDFTEGTGSI